MLQEPAPIVMSPPGISWLSARNSLTLFVAATAPEACPEDALQLTLRDFNMSNLTVCERAELTALISAGVSLDNLPNKLRAAALPAVNPMPWGHRYSSAAAGNTTTPTGVTPIGSESTEQRPTAKRARPTEQPVKAPVMKTPKITKQTLLPASHRRVKLNQGRVIATIEPAKKAPAQKTVPCKYCRKMFATSVGMERHA